MQVVIVGAGMAGLACAGALRETGVAVRLFDKGRGPGGRMSSRRTPTAAGEAQFDHGAQYFTARTAAFRRQVDAWTAAGVVASWPAAGPEALVGVPAMNALIRHLAEPLPVTWSAQVTRLEPRAGGWRVHFEGVAVDADVVVLAIPAEQVATLLAAVAPDFAASAASVVSAPCWTVMLGFDQPVGVAQDCWRSDGAIAWAARNSAKPGRTGPECWVIQASAAWSRAHLEEGAESVTAALAAELAQLLGVALPSCISVSAHRWRYALPDALPGALATGPQGALFDRARGLGVCGDWLIGPRVEAAWRSGVALAAQMGGAR